MAKRTWAGDVPAVQVLGDFVDADQEIRDLEAIISEHVVGDMLDVVLVDYRCQIVAVVVEALRSRDVRRAVRRAA